MTDLDGSGELRIDPAKKRTIDFEHFAVSIDLGDERYTISFGSSGYSTDQTKQILADSGNTTVSIADLSRRAGYFTALIGLCSNRLADPTSSEIPTDQQIAALINRSGIESKRITADIVERRLAYCRERLGLKATFAGAGTEDRNARRRLVEFATNNKIVVAEDLGRLTPR